MEDLRVLGRMFTRPIFSALAKGESLENLFGFLRGTSLVKTGRKTSPKRLFEEAFKRLSSEYRSEYIYKAALADRILFGRHSPKTASMQIELKVSKSIVDVAVFNGTATAYEVKSELDSPRRLVSQTGSYLKAFDRVFVLTHPDLASTYERVCDPRVGVMALLPSGSIRLVREAIANDQFLDRETMFRMMRRDEYVPSIEKFLGQSLGVSNGVVARYCQAAFMEMEPARAYKEYLVAMRSRTTSPDSADFFRRLPPCLRVMGYATPLSSPQRLRVVKNLRMQFAVS